MACNDCKKSLTLEEIYQYETLFLESGVMCDYEGGIVVSELSPTPGLAVQISDGVALVETDSGKVWVNYSGGVKSIAANAGPGTRNDLISILEDGTIFIQENTVTPTADTGTVLASVSVTVGATQIINVNITDERNCIDKECTDQIVSCDGTVVVNYGSSTIDYNLNGVDAGTFSRSGSITSLSVDGNINGENGSFETPANDGTLRTDILLDSYGNTGLEGQVLVINESTGRMEWQYRYNAGGIGIPGGVFNGTTSTVFSTTILPGQIGIGSVIEADTIGYARDTNTTSSTEDESRLNIRFNGDIIMSLYFGRGHTRATARARYINATQINERFFHSTFTSSPLTSTVSTSSVFYVYGTPTANGITLPLPAALNAGGTLTVERVGGGGSTYGGGDWAPFILKFSQFAI